MKRFLYFLRSTKWVSRILFLLWIVFSSFANFSNESRLQIVLQFGAFLLIPALLIEIFKNPTLKKQQSNGSEESTMSVGAKIVKLLFPFRWIYALSIAMWVYGSFFSAFSKSDGVLSGMVIYGIVFFSPIIVLEIVLYAKKNRKTAEHTATELAERKQVKCEQESPTAYRGKQISVRAQTRRAYYSQKYGVDVCNIHYINGQYLGDISAIEFMDGHTFEFFCADLLKDLGFTSVDVTPGSGDQGADILAVKDGERYAIQCKHRDDPFGVKYGNKPIQEVYTGMSFYKCNHGSVMTNGYFSKGGQSAAAATGVTLWDRDALMKMLKFAGFEQGQDRLCKREAEVVLPENKGRVTENINCYINRPIGNDTKDGTYEGILVHIDNESFAHFGIAVTDISIDRESDTDEVELLFDVVSRNAPRRDIAIDIVCNIYGAGKKLATETDMIDFEKFRGRDSISILFDKKNISQIADRIEMYCKEW